VTSAINYIKENGFVKNMKHLVKKDLITFALAMIVKYLKRLMKSFLLDTPVILDVKENAQ